MSLIRDIYIYVPEPAMFPSEDSVGRGVCGSRGEGWGRDGRWPLCL